MKKKLLIIIGTVVLVLAVVATALLIWKPWNAGNGTAGLNIEPGTPLYQVLFQLQSQEDILGVEKEFNIKATVTDGEYLFSDVDCFGQKMSFIYTFGDGQYLEQMSAYAILTAESGKEQETCTGLVNSFSALFGVEKPSSYLIYTENGVLDNASAASYADIYQGKAILEFRVRDRDATFWIMKIQNMGNDRLVCSIVHYMNGDAYADKIADLDLI